MIGLVVDRIDIDFACAFKIRIRDCIVMGVGCGIECPFKDLRRIGRVILAGGCRLAKEVLGAHLIGCLPIRVGDYFKPNKTAFYSGTVAVRTPICPGDQFGGSISKHE